MKHCPTYRSDHFAYAVLLHVSAVCYPWHMGNESYFDKTNIFKRMGLNRLSAQYVLLKHKGKFTASVVVAVQFCHLLPQRVWHNLEVDFQHLISWINPSSGLYKTLIFF